MIRGPFRENLVQSKVVPEGWAVTVTAQPSRTTLPSSVSIGLTQNNINIILEIDF